MYIRIQEAIVLLETILHLQHLVAAIKRILHQLNQCSMERSILCSVMDITWILAIRLVLLLAVLMDHILVLLYRKTEYIQVMY